MAQVCSKTPYSLIEQEGLESQYELACEHQHSCIELPARLADGGTRRMCLGFLLETPDPSRCCSPTSATRLWYAFTVKLLDLSATSLIGRWTLAYLDRL